MNSSRSDVSEGKLQRKRAESAADKEKVKDLQEIRERLAKVMHYKVPHKPVGAEEMEEQRDELV